MHMQYGTADLETESAEHRLVAFGAVLYRRFGSIGSNETALDVEEKANETCPMALHYRYCEKVWRCAVSGRRLFGVGMTGRGGMVGYLTLL